MRQRSIFFAILVLSTLLTFEDATAGKASAEALAFNCITCHGPNGNSAGPSIPSLAGMSAKYIAKSMRAFKENEREATIMNRIAVGYDNDDFRKMGEYFSAQTRIPAKQQAGMLVEKGREIHQHYCGKCHEENGTRAVNNAGILSGQWTPYLAYALEDVLDGTRRVKRKMIRQLNAMHKEEGDESIQALLDFYASKKKRRR